MTTQFQPQIPNDSDIQEAVRILLATLTSQQIYNGANPIKEIRFGGKTLWDAETNLLPIGDAEDFTDPSDIPMLWTSLVLRNFFQSVALGIIGLESVTARITDPQDDDLLWIQDSTDNYSYKLVRKRDLVPFNTGQGAINIVGTGGITASFNAVDQTLTISGDALQDSWQAAMGFSGTQRTTITAILNGLSALSDTQLETLLQVIRNL